MEVDIPKQGGERRMKWYNQFVLTFVGLTLWVWLFPEGWIVIVPFYVLLAHGYLTWFLSNKLFVNDKEVKG